MKYIKLPQLIKEGHCSPTLAEQLKKIGISPQSTQLAYDSEGKLSNSKWLMEIWNNDSAFLPAVNLYEGLAMLESLAPEPPLMYHENGWCHLTIGDLTTKSVKAVDTVCEMYLKLAK